VDKHREMRRCYNCREMDHLAARCSKLRKERKEEVRITEEVMKDFSMGRKYVMNIEWDYSYYQPWSDNE